MKKRLIALFLCILCISSILAIPANAAYYKNATNTFNVYSSSGYKRLTSGNNGATMTSEVGDGSRGYITFKRYFAMGGSWGWNTRDYGTKITYKCPKGIYEGAPIDFYVGSSKVASGKVHTYNNAKTFGSITKIDCLGGGYYLKYN